MRVKFVPLICALVVAAACGAGPATDAESTARPLAYSLSGEVRLSYDQTVAMTAAMRFRGDVAALDPSMPQRFELATEMGMQTDYTIEDGLEPGTHRVGMELSRVRLESASMVVDGEELALPDDAGLATSVGSQLVPEMEFVITDKGEVLSVVVDGASLDVGGLLGGDPLSSFGSPAQLFGPALPGGVVEVGDSWTSSYTRMLVPGKSVSVASVHRVVGTEPIDGRMTWVIETSSTMDGITLTLDDILAAAEVFGGEAQGVGFPSNASMMWTMDPSTTEATAWMDPEAGVVRRQISTTELLMVVELGGIPGAAGMVGIEATTSISHTMSLLP